MNLLNFQLKKNTVLYIQRCNSKYDWLCAKFHVNICGYFVIRHCNSNSIVLFEVFIYRFSTRGIHNKIYQKPYLLFCSVLICLSPLFLLQTTYIVVRSLVNTRLKKRKWSQDHFGWNHQIPYTLFGKIRNIEAKNTGVKCLTCKWNLKFIFNEWQLCDRHTPK